MYNLDNMKNFVFISPHFPDSYWRFCAALRKNGFRVLGVGDCPYSQLRQEVKDSLDEYYYCWDMENFDNEKRAVEYFERRYGHIDYIESNNEYWLQRDAWLRDAFHVDTGINGEGIKVYQHKSMMKEKFIKAGAKVAKYILVDTYENFIKFVEEVGFPIFAKPDMGVGAAGGFKMKNMEDVDYFFRSKDPNIKYICEQFVTGNIVSFDGVCDSNSNIIFCDSECFQPSISEIVRTGGDTFYYCLPEVPKDILELGKKIIKAFEVKNRFFHIELFRLTTEIKGLGKPGDLVGLETNMRPPGGYTPDLINFANSCDVYQIWADGMAYNDNYQRMDHPKYYAAYASRRDFVEYFYRDDEVLSTFKDNIVWHSRNPDVLADDLGNRFFMARFNTLEEVEVFHQYANRRAGQLNIPRMVHESPKRKRKPRAGETICDTHIDGA